MTRPDVRRLIDGFLTADKTVAGTASWKADPDGDAHRWIGAIEIDGEQPGITLVVKAYPRAPTLKFTIMLHGPRCFWRLDYGHAGHLNPLNAPVCPGVKIDGPHYHSWSDNRRMATANSLPKRLRNARILPAGIRSFNAAFRWFVQETNVRISSLDVPDLPQSDVLL